MSVFYTFRRANAADGDQINTWFNAPHVKEFWGEPADNIGDFQDAMSGKATLFQFWIGEDNHKPFCLLVTSSAGTDTPPHLVPYVSDRGDVWTLDVLIGSLEHVGRGLAADMLGAFLDYLYEQNPGLVSVLIDPEASNTRAIHVYGKAGFHKVSRFTPSEGSFRGKLHILMAFHYDQALDT